MKTTNVKMIAKGLINGCKHHSPAILTVIGIGGLFVAGAMAVKETPKALKLIEEEKETIAEETETPVEEVKLTPVETVKATWRCYVPSALTSIASTACLVGACKINTKRAAALATAYQISQTALSRYKNAVLETMGEKKAKAVQEKVDDKNLEPVAQQITNYYIGNDDKSNVLCFDSLSGRVFSTSIKKLEMAKSKMHDKLVCDDYSSLNYAYGLIGIEPLNWGDLLGWNLDRHGQIDIESVPKILEDGRPCLCIKFLDKFGEEIYPEYEFDKYCY